MPDLADYITSQEAADELGYNINSIYRMLTTGKLEGQKIGKKQWLILRKSVVEYKGKLSGKDKHDPWLWREKDK